MKQMLVLMVSLVASMALAEQVFVELSGVDGKVEEREIPLTFADGRATFCLDRNSVGPTVSQITVKTDFMTSRDEEVGYWILPTGELGVFEKGKSGRRNCTRDEQAPMAFYGMKTQHGTWVAIVKGMALDMDVEVVAKKGAYEIHPVFNDFKKLYEDVEIEFIRLEGVDANYSGMARAYRKYQLERGAVVPLKERVKKYPMLDYMTKHPEVRIRQAWKPVPSPKPDQTVKDEPPVKPVVTFEKFMRIVDEFKRQGITGAEFCLVGWNVGGHDGRWPQIFPVEPTLGGEEKLKEAIRHAQDLGYQVVAHCNHRDAYKIADRWDAEFIREKNPDGSLQLPKTTWGGGRMYTICPKRAYEKFVTKDMPMVAAMGFKGLHYLDVYSAVKAEPCDDPRHPLNARQSAEYVGHILQLGRDTFGGIASEGGFDQNAGQLDYVLYVTFSRPFGKMPDMVTRYIPLFQLVYNGIILSNPFTTTVNAMKKGRPSELKIVEFNARPSFYYYANFLSNGRNWMGNEDLTCEDDAALVKSVELIRRSIDGFGDRAGLQYCFMEDHEEVQRNVFRTHYSDGTTVYVNYGVEPALVENVKIPAQGYQVVLSCR